MLYKTPLLTVQCAAKGLLRDVSLLLSAVYSFHGHGHFPWRRNFFRKQCKVYFLLNNIHTCLVNVGTYCVFALICIFFVCKQKHL